MIKKVIYTLNIGGYAPDITRLTYPFLKEYAKKIDADFRIIDKRSFPGYPMMYEKLQIYDLGRDNDWNIYIDSDVLVYPSFFDVTEIMPENTVMTYNMDVASSRFELDNYFRRDGRNAATGGFFVVAPRLCSEIWEPLVDLSLKDALKRIHLTNANLRLGHKNDGYGIDDLVLSRNVARYGLRFKILPKMLEEIGLPGMSCFFHNHLVDEKQKAEQIKKCIRGWMN